VALQKGALSRALGVPLPTALHDELAARARALTMTKTNDDEGGQRGEE
jgi:hypothetical protein